MDKRLIPFILFSFIVHALILTQLTMRGRPQINENKPIIAHIIEDVKSKTTPPEHPKILSNKDVNLKKKSEDVGKKPLVTDRLKDKRQYIIPPKQPPLQKQLKRQERQKTSQHTLNKNIQTNDKSKITVKQKKEEKKVAKKTKLEKHNDLKQNIANRTISRETIEKILNPSDILSRLADKKEDGSKEGEDAVNIQAMKFKYYSYFYKFKRLLHQVWEYPLESAYRGEEGIARIQFSILKDGTITNIRLIESSGYPDLDEAAINALKTMRGIPLPSSYKLNILHVDGYFAYEIHRFYIY